MHGGSHRLHETLRELRELLPLLRAEADGRVRWHLAAALLLVVAAGLLAGLAPLALKGLVDAMASEREADATGAALAFGAAYLLALCGSRLLNEIRPVVSGRAEQRLSTRLRQRFFAHLLALPLAFHLRRRTGALLYSVHQATSGCQLLVASLVNGIVPVLVEVVTVTIVLVHLERPPLLATFAATAIAYLAIFGRGTFRLKQRTQAVSNASMNTHATLADSLLNVETIKCFSAEETVRQRLANASNELETRWLQLHGQRARIGLAATTTFALSVATSLTIAAGAVVQGTLTVGGFVLANVCMLQIVRPLEMLGAAARDLSQALEFLRPLFDVLKEPTEAPQQERAPKRGIGAGDEPPERPPTTTTASRSRAVGVSFRGVRFAYDPDRPVLHSLDLEIAAGSTMAIVGASGSGKSSMVRLLLRLYDPQAGSILLDHMPIDALPAAELRTLIGLVPQDTVLFNDTIAANIGIGRPGAPRAEIERAARLAHLHDFVATLPAGYDTLVGERGLMLSGGERQRVAIARAVLKRPRLYVFDEATSMLDSRTEAAILQGLQEVSQGCTTITIAHRLSTIQHAEDIVVLEGGTVAERGTHAALLSIDGTYARLWRMQMQGNPH